MKKNIKRSLLFILGLLLLTAITNAQSFKEDSRVLNLGVGLGTNYYKAYRGLGYSYSSIPVICLSYEQAYRKRVGPGLIGLGGLLTYQNSHSKYENYYGGSGYVNHYRWSNYVIAARAAYHWDEVNTDKFDLYGGVMVGLRFQTYSYSTDYTGTLYTGIKNTSDKSRNIYQVGGLFAGARYYFKPTVGLYGELHFGASVPYINLGLTIKL